MSGFHYVYILVSEKDSSRHYTGLTDDLEARLKGEEPLLRGVDRQFAAVHCNPSTPQFLRYRSRRAAARETVENNVTFVGRGTYDSIKELLGFLGGIVVLLRSLRLKRINPYPHIRDRLVPKCVFQVLLRLNSAVLAAWASGMESCLIIA